MIEGGIFDTSKAQSILDGGFPSSALIARIPRDNTTAGMAGAHARWVRDALGVTAAFAKKYGSIFSDLHSTVLVAPDPSTGNVAALVLVLGLGAALLWPSFRLWVAGEDATHLVPTYDAALQLKAAMAEAGAKLATSSCNEHRAVPLPAGYQLLLRRFEDMCGGIVAHKDISPHVASSVHATSGSGHICGTCEEPNTPATVRCLHCADEVWLCATCYELHSLEEHAEVLKKRKVLVDDATSARALQPPMTVMPCTTEYVGNLLHL